MDCELVNDFVPCQFRIKRASQPWEQRDAMRLRRSVFCIEQGIFVGDDRDAIDRHAQHLVALTYLGVAADQVVGTVRIHRALGSVWWGSRLAVHPSFRQTGRIGATLISLAVSSAQAQGCKTFLAHVQKQNEALFKRLHWNTLDEMVLHGKPHCLMRACLDHYLPCYDPESGLLARARTST